MVSKAKQKRKERDYIQKQECRRRKIRRNWRDSFIIILIIVIITLLFLLIKSVRAEKIECFKTVNDTEIKLEDSLIPSKTYNRMLSEWQNKLDECSRDKQYIIEDYERNISEMTEEVEEESCMLDERELLDSWDKLDNFQKANYFTFMKMKQGTNIWSFSSSLALSADEYYISYLLLDNYVKADLAEERCRSMYLAQFRINQTWCDYYPVLSEACYYKIEILTDIKTSGRNKGLMMGIPIPIGIILFCLFIYKLKVESGPIPPY